MSRVPPALRASIPLIIPRTSSKQIDGPGAAFLLLIPLLLASKPAAAQTFQFLPEVDGYTKLHPDIRFSFQAKETREAGDLTQTEIGPSFRFFPEAARPPQRSHCLRPRRLEGSAPAVLRRLSLCPFPRQTHVERLELVATPHLPSLR